MTYSAITVGPLAGVTALQNVAQLNTANASRLNVEFAVTTAALTQFQIYGRAHPKGSYQLLYSTSADFTTPKGILLGTSGDLSTQASGSSGYFQMDCTAFDSILLKAAGTSTGLTVLAGVM